MTTSRDVHPNHESAVEAARALVPVLRERAAETETRRMISEQTIEDLRRKGLLHLFTPRAFGGSELGITTFVEAAAAIASGCGSTGWVFDVLAGHLARRPRSTRRMISGVRISCMARSSLSPGMTMELARLIQLPWTIETR